MTRSNKSSVVSAIRWGILGAVSIAVAAVGASGCLDRPLCASTTDNSSEGLPEGFSGDCNPKTTNIFVDAITQNNVDKIDLLFMIDNSLSMADKQELLEDAVPDLVERLVNPVCIPDDLENGTAQQAPDIRADCPEGFTREFNPVRDIHIGVISSSLGSYGAGSCDSAGRDDKGHLVGSLGRVDWAGMMLQQPPTPFLSWFVTPQPEEPQPPNTFSDVGTASAIFQSMVVAVGETGCGFEASLEAWYRFLVDPEPPESFQTLPCAAGSTTPCTQPTGIDNVLLDQRKAFLRSDSLVAIIMLSDENDCSIQGTGQLYYAARTEIGLPKGSAACATNPNDPCCYSCTQDPPDGCQADPGCKDSGGRTVLVPEGEDNPNLRCFNQKQKFGVNFLYPTQRYVNALSNFQVCTRRADLSTADCPAENLFDNPLYSDLSGGGSSLRGPELVFLAGIVGVPYQDIQTDVNPDGDPYPAGELHFQTASQMEAQGTWADILGFPGGPPDQGGEGVPVPPRDPLMRESIVPRSATNEVVPGADPVAPGNGGHMANPINGHEWNVLDNDDLQYACIFPLGTPIDCTTIPEDEGCDCRADTNITPADTLNPLCQAPGSGPGEGYSTTQHAAKAYPGLRFLRVLRDYGDNSIVASICPRNTTDRGAQDFGYRPAIGAIVDRLKEALSGSCLPREVPVGDNGEVPCSVVEAVPEPNLGCNRPGRKNPEPLVVEPAFRRLELAGRCGGDTNRPCNQSTFTLCEVVPANERCLQDRPDQNSVGWCYVDPAKGLGDLSLVENCDPNQQRLLRFVDPNNETPAKNSTVLIACLGADLSEGQGGSSTPTGGSGGAPAATGGAGGTPPAGGTGGTAPPPTGDAGQ